MCIHISISETNESPLREWGVKLLVKGGITLKDNEFYRRLEELRGPGGGKRK